MKLKKKDLAERLAARQGICKKEAAVFLENLMDIIKEEVCKGNSIELMYFGTFYLWKRTSHLAPHRPQVRPDELQERLSLGFRPGSCLRACMNGPASAADEGSGAPDA